MNACINNWLAACFLAVSPSLDNSHAHRTHFKFNCPFTNLALPSPSCPSLSTPLSTNVAAIKCLICWPSRCHLCLSSPLSLPPLSLSRLFACLPNAKHHHNNYGKIVLVNSHTYTHTHTRSCNSALVVVVAGAANLRPFSLWHKMALNA